MGMLSLAVRTTLAAAFAVGLADTASAQSGPDLQPYTAAIFVPYADAGKGIVPFTDVPKLSFRIQALAGAFGQSAPPLTKSISMDTGSTGVAISATALPGYDPNSASNLPLGWEYLSSSNVLWVGRWIKHDLVFLDAAGNPLATAQVPVLAVEIEYNCPGWSEKLNKPICLKPKSVKRMPTGVAYVGVGFGREHDGQAQGIPDRNPLLNLTAIGGQPIAQGTYRSGYVVTPRGVHVGLSPANTQDFAWAKLQGRSLDANGNPASDDPRDWPQAGMAVSVNDQAPQAGAALIDTGIAQMYLAVPDPAQLPTQPVKNPSHQDKMSTGLTTGATVTVSFPDAANPVAQYSFTADNSTTNPDGPAPSVVLIPSAADPAFVNTGRHLLRAYDVAFDADGGWFGFRKVAP